MLLGIKKTEQELSKTSVNAVSVCVYEREEERRGGEGAGEGRKREGRERMNVKETEEGRQHAA